MGRLVEQEAILTKKEVVSLTPNFTIAYGTWGRLITNGNLIQRFLAGKDEKETSDGLKFIQATGITGRHHPKKITPFLENREKVADEMVKAGVEITKASMYAQGWDKADHIIISSSTPGDPEGFWGEEIARKCRIGSVGFSFLACDGAVAALLDVLNREELADQRVVITAVEPLGYFVNPDNLKDSTIFGNGVSSLCFRPNQITLYNGKTVVIPDEKGVICSPETYDLPSGKPQTQLPNHYELALGAENVFFYGENRVILTLPVIPEEADPRFLTMNGVRTAALFGREVPNIAASVLATFYNSYPGLRIYLCSSHQPSAGVLSLVDRRLNAVLEQSNLPPIEVPWVMKPVGMGNASSAVSFIAMAELHKLRKIKPNEPFNVTAYGIGTGLTSMNIALKTA